MRLRKFFHIICFILLYSWHGNGQQILFRNYSVAQGLPSSMVLDILQDDQGYMWFGTRNGLSRFDGYQFKNFQFKKSDSSSLGNNFIHCITKYDSTHFWIGTESGIYIFDLEKEIFTEFKNVRGEAVFGILKDRNGFVWMTTRLHGLYRYDPLKQSIIHYTHNSPGNSISLNHLSQIVENEDGKILIGTLGSGIDVYDPATGTFSNVRIGTFGLDANNIITISKGLNGILWVGTYGGLFRWNTETGNFKPYRSGGEYAIKDNIVRTIYQKSADKVYVGTEKGLNILDLATDKFTAYTNKINDPFGISDNAVYSIYLDKAGTMWMGTWFGGVNYFHESGSAFELYYPDNGKQSLRGRAVSCFLEDKPGRFWVGTEDEGLYYFNDDTKEFFQYPFLPNQQKLSYHNVHCLLRDRKGKIWIGIFAGGVNALDPQTGKVTTYLNQPGKENSINNNLVFSLYEDRDGIIWAGTAGGLNRYDEQTNSFTSIQQEGVENTLIYDMYEDNNRTIWFATNYNGDNGLVAYNKKNGEWKKVNGPNGKNPLSSTKLVCLHDDHAGNLWIGTDGGGLNRFNFKTRQVQVYDETMGIDANIIYGIQEDDSGLLWLTSNNGIYSLNTQTGKVNHFSKQDNLQSQQFNYKAFYKASDGKLFAGGIRGFNAFYPEQVVYDNNSSGLSITKFQLFNKDVSLSEDGSPLAKQISYTKEISLSHDQSVMSFEFSALNYAAPDKVQYAYKMEGFDPDWNYVGEQRRATYTNLSPGHYKFKVKATTDASNWNVAETSIAIIIRPPFYKTPLAYLLYVLFGIALAYAIYKYSVRYIKKQNEIKLERLKNKEEQEFYARKIEFFTVMAHEIRTPLTLIIAPLEKLLALHKWDKSEKEQLQIMDENAERLMDLVNQLLDFRRIESDAYEIKPEKVEVVSLVQSIYSRFSAIPYQKDLEFSMVTNTSNLTIQADPEVLQKILSNLLINAFKFARKKVVLTLHEISRQENGDQSFSVSVEDDGIGIPNTDIKNIFRKFFTTTKGDHEYHNLGGSGIGLALASSLAERHGGRLLVESKENVKTIFTLELPVRPEKIAQKVTPEIVAISNGEEDDTGTPMVLVADDDEAILSFIVSSLKTDGYRASGVTNGKQALDFMESNAVDLVISDIMMPVMNGFEFCKTVKNDINYSHIPFVLLTARGNSEAEIEGIETGADAYIMKPFKWKHLSAVIKNLIESREKLKQRFSEHPQSEIGELATNSRDKLFMEKVVQIIEDRIIDPQLSVEELSKDMAMSRSNLHKKLKSLSGFGPNELIKLVRLKHAAKLLQTEDLSIAEIGYRTGFSSPSYFSKCFMQQFKVGPKEYAERYAVIDRKEIDELLDEGDST